MIILRYETEDRGGTLSQEQVHSVSINPEVTLTQEQSEAPVPFHETLSQAQALVKPPSWIRMPYVRTIRNLQCFEIVRRQSLDGIPASEVARAIHTLGELTEIDLSQVTEYVRHYRATLPKAEVAAHKIIPKNLEEKLAKRVNVRDDLEKLKNWMFDRLEIAVSREKGFGMLIPNTEKSFQVALDIVSKIQEIQEKEIGNPEEVKAQGHWTKTDFDQLYGKPGINDTLKNPVSRMKIARFLDQTMQLVGGMDDQKRERLLEEAKRQVEVLPPEGK